MYSNRFFANLGMNKCKLTKVPIEPRLVAEKNTYKNKSYPTDPAKIKRYQMWVRFSLIYTNKRNGCQWIHQTNSFTKT